MPGLYIHIPFCRKACNYCNFHFSTSIKGHQEMVDAIVSELRLRNDEMPTGPWSSIYFGGGTPSLLSPKQVTQILDAATALRPLVEAAEITLEANPDDLTEEVIAAFAETSINRFSIGIQSFLGEDLTYMNRAHDSAQAVACIPAAQVAGFDNLTIDMIYGTPGMSDEAWRQNLQQAIAFGTPHISSYALTVEPKTALAHQIKTGQSTPVDEAQSARQMEILIDTLEAAGYEHYEISNFAKPGWRAKHNSNYWLGHPYLGVGPSAHSFDGSRTRSWNVANNALYVKAITLGDLPIEREVLSDQDRYNELVLTRLRTTWGVKLSEVEALGFEAHFLKEVKTFVERQLVEETDGSYRLTRAGKLLADGVSGELFSV
ncbi:MAG: radical SAM family heme chaperone HemW [Saprospiraceae bacterium]